MELRDILAKLAEFDEMEQQDGMNIVEGEEEFDNERSDNKRKARIYKKAVIALEELQDLLAEDADPATGKLDDETDAFYNTLTGIINEIDSRSLAFDESLDEAVVLKDKLTDGNDVKSELFQIGIAVNKHEEDIYLGTISYGSTIKRLSTTDYAGEDVVADVTAIIKQNMDNMENQVKDLLNLI